VSKENVRFVNLAVVLVSTDIMKTVDYYRDIMGFKIVEHFEGKEKFSTLYRDEIEIIIVQSKYGEVRSNNKNYGAGYDIYIAPDTVEGVDLAYNELKSKGAKIISTPQVTEYGSYEFVMEDIDGRLIGIGKIKNKNKFFKNTKI
jgi:predicted lactoylglutathione lyase